MPLVRNLASGKGVWSERFHTAGIDDAVWQREGSATKALGVAYTLRGEVEKVAGIQTLVTWSPSNPISGSVKCYGLHTFTHHGATEILMVYNGTVSVVTSKTVSDLDTTRFVPTRASEADRIVQVGDIAIICNGRDRNLVWDGHVVSPLGIASAPTAPTAIVLAEQQGTAKAEMWSPLSITAGDEYRYNYKLTWVNERGQESNPSPASFTVDEDDISGTVQYHMVVLCDTNPPADDVVERNLYRATDGVTYKFVGNLRGVSAHHWFDGITPGGEDPAVLHGDADKSAPPIARFCFPFRERVYFLPADNPSLLVFSNLNEKEGVAATNLLDVASRDGEEVTGWAVPSDYALVFKENSVFRLTHDKNGLPILRRESNSVGAVGDLAIATFEGSTYFLHRTGLFVYDGSTFNPLSLQLSELVRRLPGAYLEDAFMWTEPERRRVMLSVCAGPGSGHNEVWAIHVDSGALTRLPFEVDSAVRYRGETYVGFTKGDDTTNLGLLGAGQTVDGDAYDGKNDTRWLDMGSPLDDKRFQYVIIHYVQTADIEVTFNYAVNWDDRTVKTATFKVAEQADEDGNGGAVLWNDGVWGAARTWDFARLRSVRVNLSDIAGKSIRFGWSTEDANTPWRIVGLDIHFHNNGAREQGIDPEANSTL